MLKFSQGVWKLPSEPLNTLSGKALSICHVDVGDLWAGAEVQHTLLLLKLIGHRIFRERLLICVTVRAWGYNIMKARSTPGHYYMCEMEQ